jgi:hypothetical protein
MGVAHKTKGSTRGKVACQSANRAAKINVMRPGLDVIRLYMGSVGWYFAEGLDEKKKPTFR